MICTYKLGLFFQSFFSHRLDFFKWPKKIKSIQS